MKDKEKALTITLLFVYCLLLVWIVLLKASSVSELRYLVCERSVNLLPFHYEIETDTHFSEVILNVIVFVPFGLFLGMLGVRAWETILWGFSISLLFEALQYIFSIGAADVTDLLTNTAGTALGLLVYLLLSRIFRRSDKLNRVLNILSCIGMCLFIMLAAFLLFANG